MILPDLTPAVVLIVAGYVLLVGIVLALVYAFGQAEHHHR